MKKERHPRPKGGDIFQIPTNYFLHEECCKENCSLEKLKVLLENKIDINTMNENEDTPLHLICANKTLSYDLVKFLIEKKSNMDLSNKDGKYPLHLVCENQSVSFEIIKLMIEMKSNFLATDKKGNTSFHCLCSNNKATKEMVEYFIKDLQFDVNLTNDSNETPFLNSCQNAASENIKYLLEIRGDLSVTSYSKDTTLMNLCKNQNITFELVKHFVESKCCDLNVKNKTNSSFLSFALQNQKADQETINFLIQQESDFNQINQSKESLLHGACFNPNLSMHTLKLLIDKGIYANPKNYEKITPLHILCNNENSTFEMIKFLIENKALVTSLTLKNQDSPLHLYCRRKNPNVETLKYLLEMKSCVNLKNNLDLTPLYVLSENASCNHDLINTLIEANAHINSVNSVLKKTTFHSACQNKNISLDSLKLFVENKAHLNIKDDKDETPLHFAVSTFSSEMIKLLLESKSFVSCKNTIGNTPLHCSFLGEKIELNTIKSLIESKSTINSNNKTKNTPLHLACSKSYTPLDVVEFLIENKAKVNSLNQDMKTPLHLALENGVSNEILKILISNYNQVHIQVKHVTNPFHSLYSNEDNQLPVETIKFMVENKSDFNTRNEIGNCLIHSASKKGNIELVKYLVELKANINSKNKNGSTPLHLYCGYKETSFENVKYLVEMKSDLNAKNKNGSIPLTSAVYNLNTPIETLKYLIESKSLPRPFKHGTMLLQQKHSSYEKIKLFFDLEEFVPSKFTIESFSEIKKKRNNWGWENNPQKTISYPLHIAVKHHNIDVIKYIAERCGTQMESNEPLLAACRGNPSPIVLEYLLQLGASINGTVSPLHTLISNPNAPPESINLLINKKASITHVDEHRNTFLHLVCSKKNASIETVKLLVNNGLPVDSLNYSNSNALHFLNHKNPQLEIISNYLIEMKVDPNTKNSHKKNSEDQWYINTPSSYHKNNALHWACFSEKVSLEYIKSLIENKCGINTRNSESFTPLHLLCSNPNYSFDAIKFLVEQRAFLNQPHSIKSVLHCAVKNPNADLQLIEYLIQNGSNVNNRTLFGMVTPLTEACKVNKNPDILLYLLDQKANINSKDKSFRTPLSFLAINKEISTEIIQKFIELKAEINSPDKLGNTPLNMISTRNDLTRPFIKFLLKNKANFVKTGNKNPTAIEKICKNVNIPCEIPSYLMSQKISNPKGNDECLRSALINPNVSLSFVKQIIEKKASLEANNIGLNDTPLHIACNNQNISIEIVKYLVEQKSSINVPNKKKDTPLSIATSKCSLQIIKYLIKSKGDLNFENNYKKTPLQRALSKHKFVVPLITFLAKETQNTPIFEENNQLIVNKEEPKKKTTFKKHFTILHGLCSLTEITPQILNQFLNSMIKNKNFKSILNTVNHHNQTALHILCNFPFFDKKFFLFSTFFFFWQVQTKTFLWIF